MRLPVLENTNNEVSHDDDSRDDEDVDNHRDDENDTEIHAAQEPVNGNANKEDFGNYNIMKHT